MKYKLKDHVTNEMLIECGYKILEFLSPKIMEILQQGKLRKTHEQ